MLFPGIAASRASPEISPSSSPIVVLAICLPAGLARPPSVYLTSSGRFLFDVTFSSPFHVYLGAHFPSESLGTVPLLSSAATSEHLRPSLRRLHSETGWVMR